MKKFLPLLLVLAALPLFQSCVAPNSYGVSYGTATNFGSSVGLIATSHSRWGYDPFTRAYYDYSLGQYYDLNRGRYFTTLPRRFSTPFFPSYYTRGSILRCPPGLPHLRTSFRRPSYSFISTGHSRWAYDPYRRCYYDHQSKRFFNHNAGRYYTSLPRRYSSPRYPSGYRSGQRVGLHSSLPYVNHRTHSRGHSNRDYRSDRSRSYSRNRDQRSVFTSGRDLRPSVGIPNYRSRSNVSNNRGGRSSTRNQQNSQPRQRAPQRQVTRQSVQPSGGNFAERMRQAVQQQAAQQSEARAAQEAMRSRQAAQMRESRGYRGSSNSPRSRGSSRGGNAAPQRGRPKADSGRGGSRSGSRAGGREVF